MSAVRRGIFLTDGSGRKLLRKGGAAPGGAVAGVSGIAVPHQLAGAGFAVGAVVNGEVKEDLPAFLGGEAQGREGNRGLERVALAVHIGNHGHFTAGLGGGIHHMRTEAAVCRGGTEDDLPVGEPHRSGLIQFFPADE